MGDEGDDVIAINVADVNAIMADAGQNLTVNADMHPCFSQSAGVIVTGRRHNLVQIRFFPGEMSLIIFPERLVKFFYLIKRCILCATAREIIT